MEALLAKYGAFHQLMLSEDGLAINFYKQLGFDRAGRTESMWIYAGTEHRALTPTGQDVSLACDEYEDVWSTKIESGHCDTG